MKAQASSTKERSIAGRESTILKLVEIGSAAQEEVLDARETLEGEFSKAKQLAVSRILDILEPPHVYYSYAQTSSEHISDDHLSD